MAIRLLAFVSILASLLKSGSCDIFGKSKLERVKPFIPITGKDMPGVVISIRNMLVNFEHKVAIRKERVFLISLFAFSLHFVPFKNQRAHSGNRCAVSNTYTPHLIFG
jgi:hypothetical protein